jgi:protein AbiQ
MHNKEKGMSRPYVGVLLPVGDLLFFAPMTSPKQRHLRMKNGIDFTKIDGGRLGAINFNNMIPIKDKTLATPVSLKIHASASEQDRRYKNLLRNQSSWCRTHSSNIENKAKNLYLKYSEGKLPERVLARCCDFTLLIEKARLYLP